MDSRTYILRSATPFNTTIAVPRGTPGRICAGFAADLIVLDGDPLKDRSIFERRRGTTPISIRSGRFGLDDLQ